MTKKPYLTAVFVGFILMWVACARPADDAAGRRRAPEGLVQNTGGAPFTNFCLKKLLQDKDGRLYCNWIDNFSGACAITFPSNRFIEKGAVISGPEDLGKCSDGNVVVKVTSN